jgi:hypothetical protein
VLEHNLERRPTEQERVPKVAVQHADQESTELDDDRLVVTVLV